MPPALSMVTFFAAVVLVFTFTMSFLTRLFAFFTFTEEVPLMEARTVGSGDGVGFGVGVGVGFGVGAAWVLVWGWVLARPGRGWFRRSGSSRGTPKNGAQSSW